MAKYHVKKDGTPGVCHAQEGNCPLGDSSQHFSNIQDAQDYADKINEEKAELSSMNTEEVKNRALEDNENGDKYRTELYNRLSNNTERKEFKLKEMKGNDFNSGNSGASISINDNSYVNNGFAVSPYPEYSKAIPGDVTDEQIQTEVDNYIKEHKDVLEKPNHILGLWRSPYDNNLYLDVSIISKDASEAREISKKEDQQAYFYFQTGEAITVDKNATSGQVQEDNYDFDKMKEEIKNFEYKKFKDIIKT